MINFNELPQEKPGVNGVIPKGNYIAKIEKAEMKIGKDETKPPYLNLQLEITDPASQTVVGKVWTILTETPKDFPRYQLRRFIEATGLTTLEKFELKDLTKLVVNKRIMVDITPEERTDGKEPQRSVVDISGGLFYPIEVSEETVPFDAPTIKPETTPEDTTSNY